MDNDEATSVADPIGRCRRSDDALPDPQRSATARLAGRRIALLLNNDFSRDSRSWKMATSLAAIGARVTVVARVGHGLPSREETGGVTVIRLEQPRPLGSLPTPGLPPSHPGGRGGSVRDALRDSLGRAAQAARYLLLTRAWERVIATALPDGADSWQAEGLLTLPVALRLRARYGGIVVYDSRDIHLESAGFARLPGPWRRLLANRERAWARSADAIVTVNEPYAAYLKRSLGRPATIVYNGPTAYRPPEPAERRWHDRLDLMPATRIALMVGTVTAHRGIEQACAAIGLVDDAALVIVGDGDARERIEAAARRLPHADRVHFVDALSPADLLPWTAAADVAVMPIQPSTENHRLTTPTRLFDAMGAGVPVVASDLPGMAAIVRTTGIGVLVDPGDPVDIARGIRAVLDGPPATRREYRAAALAAAAGEFAWSRSLERLVSLHAETGIVRAPDRDHRGQRLDAGAAPATQARIAYLSYSTGEFDSRTQRMARSALDVGFRVTVYTRWEPGLPLLDTQLGYRIVRVPSDFLLAIPLLRGWGRRRIAERLSSMADGRAVTTSSSPSGSLVNGTGIRPARTPLWAIRGVYRRVRRVFRPLVRQLVRQSVLFPLRPMGWAVALEEAVEPAEIWHGMWAGSLPALVRLRRRFGGRTVYDSRDIYLHARAFDRMNRAARAVYAWIERRWAHAADAVLTVNDAYAMVLERTLRIPRPPVVMNCPVRWHPPSPRPERIREALGLPAATAVVLYQGNLMTERGIEQSMEAILAVDDAVLVLLGYGGLRDALAVSVGSARYAGRVHLLPPVPPSDLLHWTASADVLVMAIQPTTLNHRYTTPQKLFEALAAGVPVVASDLPGMAEVVMAAGAGELCDPTDPGAIAGAIRRILEASPEERAAMRERALRAAHDRYNWEAQVEPLFDLYDRLLEGPDERPGSGRHGVR